MVVGLRLGALEESHLLPLCNTSRAANYLSANTPHTLTTVGENAKLKRYLDGIVT